MKHDRRTLLTAALAAPLALALAGASSPAPQPAGRRPLRVGVTLHPYFSWAQNVTAGTDIIVVPVLPGEVDVDAYQPRAEDIALLGTLDVLVRNGLGHDAFLNGMIAAASNPALQVVDINAETATLPERGGAQSSTTRRNSHTFLSITNAVQQSALLARVLGQRDGRPDVAVRLQDNAANYARRLRRLLQDASVRLAAARTRRVVTVHDGYGYLLQELGLELVGVVEPAHGLLPSAGELAELRALLGRARVDVVLAEERFPPALARTLGDGGARTFVVSHVATGAYTADKFEAEMKANLDTIVAALTSPAGSP